MNILFKEKELAIKLRKQGQTYGEIKKKVSVSKSTLSLWLRNVKVPEALIARITQKKLDAVRLGWAARRNQRITRTKQITDSARKEVKALMQDSLWVTGVSLYWAEGHKEKSWRPGALVTFTNMDPDTLIIFMKWCKKFLKITNQGFAYSVYIHDSHKEREGVIVKHWSKLLRVSVNDIVVYYKKTKSKHVRHNDGEQYFGVFRIGIRKSVDMNRRIAAWTTELVRSLKTGNALA